METQAIADSLKEGSSLEIHSIRKDHLVLQKSNYADSFDNVSASVENLDELKIDGRRIVDLNFVLEQLREQFSNHNSPDECPFSAPKLLKYVDRGLRTQLFFKCNDCGSVSSVWTDHDHADVMGINESAVLGTISSGTRYNTLEESLATMAIPSMSHVTYRKYRDKLYDKFVASSERDMQTAAAAKRQIAISKGHIIASISYIKVIADGYWPERSYHVGEHD